MGLFDIFKKDTGPDYDPTNVRLTDLRENFMLDYDLKTWQVVEMYEYDWGDDYFSYEYKLDSGDDTIFLSVVEDDEVEVYVTRKIRISAIDEDIEEAVEEDGKPPKKLHYKGKTFYRDAENAGYFRNTKQSWDNAAEFVSWDYYDEDEKYILAVEQWGDNTFDAAFGMVEKEFAFSNIIPA